MTAPRAPDRRRTPPLAVGAVVLGAVGLAVGVVLDPRRAAAAYLTAYVAALAVVLGMLAMLMIAPLTRATWFHAWRRYACDVSATLPIFALLFLPILCLVHRLYPWAYPPEALSPSLRASLHTKAAYLNVPCFVGRAAIYWAVWLALGALLRRGPRRQARRIGVVGLPLFAFTVTFAAFDWMMSLTPAWYSTIYGVDFFAGGMVGALALLALLAATGSWRGGPAPDVGPDHLQPLGNLLLTFVLFWIYIGYAQFIVIWSAELPAEVTWYVPRVRGGWWWLVGLVLVGHFAVPLCALLLRAVKRSLPLMGLLGAWLLLMHYLDLYWLVMPDAAAPRAGSLPAGSQWLDAAALAFVAGAAVWAWAWRARGGGGRARLPLR